MTTLPSDLDVARQLVVGARERPRGDPPRAQPEALDALPHDAQPDHRGRGDRGPDRGRDRRHPVRRRDHRHGRTAATRSRRSTSMPDPDRRRSPGANATPFELCGLIWRNDLFDPANNNDPDPNDGTTPVPPLVACTGATDWPRCSRCRTGHPTKTSARPSVSRIGTLTRGSRVLRDRDRFSVSQEEERAVPAAVDQGMTAAGTSPTTHVVTTTATPNGWRQHATDRRGVDRGVARSSSRCQYRNRKDDTMRYTLLMHYPELMASGDLTEQQLAEGMAAFDAYAKALDGAGVLESAEVLQPSVRDHDRLARRAASSRCRTARSPTRRSSWPARSSSTCPTWMPPCLGGEDAGRAVRQRRDPPERHALRRWRLDAVVVGASDSADEVRAAAERAARTSYGRLVALLAAPTRDIALAEDALADAFEQALRTWPQAGVPDNPDAWLLTVARNRQRDVWRSAAHRTTAVAYDETHRERDRTSPPYLETSDRTAQMDPALMDLDAIPDQRLELLFVCAHPAIEAGARTPLMLQTVLGFEAAQIARAFAMPPAAMAQRLVRAKRRIRDAGIPFAVPARDDMPARLAAVLEAIYGAYAIDWQGDLGRDGARVARRRSRCIWL